MPPGAVVLANLCFTVDVFFLFQREISEVCLPVIVKLCPVIGNRIIYHNLFYVRRKSLVNFGPLTTKFISLGINECFAG